MFRKRNHHGPIAIDIGAAGVKLLQLAQRDGKPSVLAAFHRTLSTSDPQDRRSALVEAIREGLNQAPFAGREVVTALGTGEFQMKSLRLPKMPTEELAGAVEFEAQDRFELDGKAAQFRHLCAGDVRHGNEIKQEVIVFAAMEQDVADRLELLESVRLRSVAVDLAPLAAARGFMRFLRRAEDSAAVNVFVDIGWRGATVIITHGTEIAFLKQVEAGGMHFTAATAHALSLDTMKAQELRIKRMQAAAGSRAKEHGSINPDIDNAVTDALRPLVEKLLKEIQLCLRYFAVTFRGSRPECVTLVGGDASEPAIMSTFNKELDVACTIGHPLRGIAQPSGVFPREDVSFHPAWAVACGLALRGSTWVQPMGCRAESRGLAAV